jgi:superfamily II DNA or RNA helicase
MLTVSIDNLHGRFSYPTPDMAEYVKRLNGELSTHAPGYQYQYEYKKWLKSGRKYGWDGRVKVMKGDVFPAGMWEFVHDKLKSWGAPFEVADRRPNLLFNKFNSHTVPLRDYQKTAVDSLLYRQSPGLGWSPRGVLKVATGGGKTEIAVAITQMIDRPTLFLVHRKDLLVQAAERYEKYGMDVGRLGAGSYDLSNKIIVATMQTLLSKLRQGDAAVETLMQDAELVFFDEAHLMAADVNKGNQFIALSRKMPNAFFRIGLTATPFLRDAYSNWLLESAAGPLTYEISNDELIKRGYLTKPKVEVHVVTGKQATGDWKAQYNKGVVDHHPRNKKIIELLKSSPKPALVMVQRTEHLDNIENLAQYENVIVRCVQGSTPLKSRRAYVAELQDGSIDAILCTTVFDEGIDVPELKTVILAGGGKSPVKARQRVGRGLRLHDSKSEVLIIDFMDEHGKYLHRHSKERMRVWRSEGFDVEVKY